jgi:hypothetical protein
MATGGRLKFAKNHYFALFFFSHQNWFQSATTSQWIERELKAFQRRILVTLRSTWGHFQPVTCSKFSWWWGGDSAPLQSPQTEGGTSPWCNIWMGDGAEKVVTFLTTFLKRKTVFGV